MTSDLAPHAHRLHSRILIAEDDQPLRMMFQKALTAAGFQVEAVGDGDAAREAYQRQCPDVLLADLVLPGLNGQKLASECRRECPDTTIIFMSGYSEEELHRLEIKQVVFLAKPLSPATLVKTLDRLLEERG